MEVAMVVVLTVYGHAEETECRRTIMPEVQIGEFTRTASKSCMEV